MGPLWPRVMTSPGRGSTLFRSIVADDTKLTSGNRLTSCSDDKRIKGGHGGETPQVVVMECLQFITHIKTITFYIKAFLTFDCLNMQIRCYLKKYVSI